MQTASNEHSTLVSSSLNWNKKKTKNSKNNKSQTFEYRQSDTTQKLNPQHSLQKSFLKQ